MLVILKKKQYLLYVNLYDDAEQSYTVAYVCVRVFANVCY